MHILPYLYFNGRCDEALAFYGRAAGAKATMLMRFKENPQPPQGNMLPPGWENKVMHCRVSIGDSTVLFSDGNKSEPAKFQNFALTLVADNEADAERSFALLAEGGKVTMPLAKTFFSPKFGMLADKFGVTWMVFVEQ